LLKLSISRNKTEKIYMSRLIKKFVRSKSDESAG